MKDLIYDFKKQRNQLTKLSKTQGLNYNLFKMVYGEKLADSMMSVIVARQ